MSDSHSGRGIPIWMFVVCWITLAPILIDSEVPIYVRVFFFVTFAALTVGLLRHKVTST